MAHDVFISYSSADKATADRLCHALEAKGLRCWIAPRDVAAGADWQEAIMTALAAAPAMVLVFTDHANGSAHVRREVSAALEAGAIVVPFRTEEAVPKGALKYNLINLHWLDATSPPLEAHIDALVRTLRRLEAEPEDDRPPPALGAPGASAPPDLRLEIVAGLAALIGLLGALSSLAILALAVTVPLILRARFLGGGPAPRRASRRLRLLAVMAVVIITIAAIATGRH
ncbi:MAG TPA: toll/interleukin-1 receptor domain-containing protein [Caulobacteraceae bacterium]|nr:toll/interleukin-1 receptor domain-containing protein [Caulobacteraceae bacterium]